MKTIASVSYESQFGCFIFPNHFVLNFSKFMGIRRDIRVLNYMQKTSFGVRTSLGPMLRRSSTSSDCMVPF